MENNPEKTRGKIFEQRTEIKGYMSETMPRVVAYVMRIVAFRLALDCDVRLAKKILRFIK